ncbi:hypothetical protein TNCT_569071 [Trichonephila clavata]|uniref:DUF4817 domain-containing protein n=1 Tax=Trichonephila clavata TaxID=2740835 RepID=A0A8X6HP89_TRICU|nr:hypothetical protein TNCT_569071 [Trichonephila clavata]
MNLMYDAVNVNDRAVLQLYQERFPSRCMPNHKTFRQLHRQLCEKGSFITSTDGRDRSRTTNTLGRSHRGPSTPSTRAVACRLHVSQLTGFSNFQYL